MYLYLQNSVYVKRIFHRATKVRNKTTYEAPSFHTSGTPRNVPCTILTRNHMFSNNSFFLSILIKPAILSIILIATDSFIDFCGWWVGDECMI